MYRKEIAGFIPDKLSWAVPGGREEGKTPGFRPGSPYPPRFPRLTTLARRKTGSVTIPCDPGPTAMVGHGKGLPDPHGARGSNSLSGQKFRGASLGGRGGGVAGAGPRRGGSGGRATAGAKGETSPAQKKSSPEWLHFLKSELLTVNNESLTLELYFDIIQIFLDNRISGCYTVKVIWLCVFCLTFRRVLEEGPRRIVIPEACSVKI
jgi:hypothetical protein